MEKALDLKAKTPGLYLHLTEDEIKAQGLKKMCLNILWAGPGIQLHRFNSKTSTHFLLALQRLSFQGEHIYPTKSQTSG